MIYSVRYISYQEPTENLTTLISSYSDSALEFWWQSLAALMLDALAFIYREHPRGFYYILVNLKEKEAGTKELKTALQYTEPSKESPAIKQNQYSLQSLSASVFAESRKFLMSAIVCTRHKMCIIPKRFLKYCSHSI